MSSATRKEYTRRVPENIENIRTKAQELRIKLGHPLNSRKYCKGHIEWLKNHKSF